MVTLQEKQKKFYGNVAKILETLKKLSDDERADVVEVLYNKYGLLYKEDERDL